METARTRTFACQTVFDSEEECVFAIRIIPLTGSFVNAHANAAQRGGSGMARLASASASASASACKCMQVPVLTIDTRTRLPELAKAFGETRSGPRGL